MQTSVSATSGTGGIIQDKVKSYLFIYILESNVALFFYPSADNIGIICSILADLLKAKMQSNLDIFYSEHDL